MNLPSLATLFPNDIPRRKREAMPKSKKRAKRYKRRTNPPGIHIQIPRDLDILQALYQHRVLRQDQLEQLFFKSKERAQKRLRLLYDHRYVDRRFLAERIGGGGRKPNLYVIDRRGIDLLKEERPELDLVWHHSYKDLSDPYLKHALPLNDIMVAIHVACRILDCQVHDWQTEAQLKANHDRVKIHIDGGQRQWVTIIPDTYFFLWAHQRGFPCFVEYDGGTERSKVIKNKIRAYKAYYETGQYKKRYGYKAFRVLFVSKSEQRVQDLKTWTEELNIVGHHWFWFGVLKQLSPDKILTAPIWHYAGSTEPRSLIQTASP